MNGAAETSRTIHMSKYAEILQASTPSMGASMWQLDVLSLVDLEDHQQRARTAQVDRTQEFQAIWPASHISRVITPSSVDAGLRRFVKNLDDRNVAIGTAVPAEQYEVPLISGLEMSTMLTERYSKLSRDAGAHNRARQRLLEDAKQINYAMRDLFATEVAIEKVHMLCEDSNLYSRALQSESNAGFNEWPSDVTDPNSVGLYQPVTEFTGFSFEETSVTSQLNGLWAPAELELADEVVASGLQRAAIGLSGASRSLLVTERKKILEVLHDDLGYNVGLLPKKYNPVIDVLAAYADTSLVGAQVIQPRDIPYFVSMEEPRAIVSPLQRQR